MRAILGTCLCLLAAGCAIAPVAVGPEARAAGTPEVHLHRGGVSESVGSAPTLALPLRLGVEFLPPDPILSPALGATCGARSSRHGTLHSPAGDAVGWEWAGGHDADLSDGPAQIVVESAVETTETRTGLRRESPGPPERPGFWERTEAELATIESPIERLTMMFLHGLMGEDRRRLQRELGMPLLASQHIDLSSPLLESMEDPLAAEERERFLSRNGNRLLRRPFRRALKNTTVIRDLELLLEAFKAENVATSHAYQEHHDGGRDWGHVSMRVRLNDFDDPIELTYNIRGVRIGSSREKLKVSWSERLADDVHFNVRTHHTYGEGNTFVRCDLIWEYDPRTLFAVVGGTDLNFLASSDAYSFFESPMDGAPGVLVYAQHIF